VSSGERIVVIAIIIIIVIAVVSFSKWQENNKAIQDILARSAMNE